MGVVHVLEGQRRVENGLDGRRRRRGPGHVGDELVDHLGVGERGQPGEPHDRPESHRGEPGRLDGLQVPPAPLDVEDVLLLAEQIALADLDRRVSPAMEHQRLVPPQQTRGIDPQAEVAFVVRGFVVVPEALHGPHPPAPSPGPPSTPSPGEGETDTQSSKTSRRLDWHSRKVLPVAQTPRAPGISPYQGSMSSILSKVASFKATFSSSLIISIALYQSWHSPPLPGRVC